MIKNKTFLLAIAVATTVGVGAFLDPYNIDLDHRADKSNRTGSA
ncbi:MAG: hypothetical protein ACYTFA_18055 [Planctomycetota bacterium]